MKKSIFGTQPFSHTNSAKWLWTPLYLPPFPPTFPSLTHSPWGGRVNKVVQNSKGRWQCRPSRPSLLGYMARTLSSLPPPPPPFGPIMFSHRVLPPCPERVGAWAGGRLGTESSVQGENG